MFHGMPWISFWTPGMPLDVDLDGFWASRAVLGSLGGYVVTFGAMWAVRGPRDVLNLLCSLVAHKGPADNKETRSP